MLAGRLRRAAAARPLLIAAVLLAGVWTADQAIGPGIGHDSGSYHYQFIRWAGEYPVVPGLGNLKFHYAYNPAHLLYAAMLNVWPWQGRVGHVANGLLLWALWAQVILGAAKLRHPAPRRRLHAAFDVMLLPVVGMLLFSREVPSPSTDLPSALLCCVIGRCLLGFLEPAGATADRERLLDFVILATLCAAAVCVKLSAAFFAGTSWIIAAAAWWRHGPRKLREPGLLWALALSTVLVAAWAGRNVVLSGYPLFPSPALGAPVGWRMPDGNVRSVRRYLSAEARTRFVRFTAAELQGGPFDRYASLIAAPHWNDVEGWEWFRPWLLSLPVTAPVSLLIPLLVTGAAWGSVPWKRGAPAPAAGGTGPAPWLLVPCAAGVVSWFLLKPDPRFVFGVAWTMAAASAAAAYRVRVPRPGRRHAAAMLAGATVMALAAAGHRVAILAVIASEGGLGHVPFRGPGPDRGFHPYPTVNGDRGDAVGPGGQRPRGG